MDGGRYSFGRRIIGPKTRFSRKFRVFGADDAAPLPAERRRRQTGAVSDEERGALPMGGGRVRPAAYRRLHAKRSRPFGRPRRVARLRGYADRVNLHSLKSSSPLKTSRASSTE